MEFNFLKTQLSRLDKVYEGSIEQSIDAEITLPDYYPEVSRVHCCNAMAVVHNRQCANESVSLGGQVNISIIYSDSNGGINLFEHTVPFNKSVDVKQNVDGMNAKVSAKINYINHKAVAPRKLEIHGSAMLNIVCESLTSEEILSETEDSGVYVKSQKIDCLEPLAPVRKLTYVEDDISVGTHPPVDKILRTDYKVRVAECKFVNSKAVIKGDLDIEIIYLCSEGKCHKLTRNQGFSQIIECDGVSEDTVCRASASVVSFETRIKSSNEGDNRIVGFEAKVETKLECHNRYSCAAVCDAFSSKCAISAEYKTVSVMRSIDSFSESFVCSKTFELPESGGDIIDSYCEVANRYSAVDDGKLVVKGELNITVMYKTLSDEVECYVKPVDFDYRCDLDDGFSGDVDVNAWIKTLNVTCGNGGSVGAEAEICIEVCTKQTEDIVVLQSIMANENECNKMGDDTAAVLYFAEGETVWEVAKKYGVCPETVCRLNREEDLDCKCNKILLIPNC